VAKFLYSAGAAIDEIQFVANETGGVRAYVHASNTATPEDLIAAKQFFQANNWKTVATTVDNRPVLEVRGFDRASTLNKALMDHQLVGGLESVVKSVTEHQQMSFWRKASLRIAGLSYNIGDVGYMTYAFKKYAMEKNAHAPHEPGQGTQNFFNVMDIVAGVGYAVGSLALTRYGHGDRSHVMIQSTSKNIKDYLTDSGVEVPKDSELAVNAREKKGGFFTRIDNFCKKYPSETFNGIYIFVGIFLGAAAFFRAVRCHTLAGVKEASGDMIAAAKHMKDAKEEALDVGLGAMTFASAMTGLVVKEKKIEPDERRHGLGRILDWIQEKPLRATGLGYAISTGFHAASTYKKYTGGDAIAKNTIIGRGVFVGSNVLSEFLLFFSSKGHGDGVKPDKSVDDSVYAATADLILRQPESKRVQLTSNVAGYLASSDVLGADIAVAQTKLEEHIAKLAKNPWAAVNHSSKATPAQVTTVEAEKALDHNRPRATISAARELLPVIEPNKAAAQLAAAH
jgi:hypothetical protein